MSIVSGGVRGPSTGQTASSPRATVTTENDVVRVALPRRGIDLSSAPPGMAWDPKGDPNGDNK